MNTGIVTADLQLLDISRQSNFYSAGGKKKESKDKLKSVSQEFITYTNKPEH